MGAFHGSIVGSPLKSPGGPGFKRIRAFCGTEDAFLTYVDSAGTCRGILTDLDISASAEGNVAHKMLELHVLTNVVAVTIPNKNSYTFEFSHHASQEYL